jgi:hypothetical protein
MPWVCLKNQTIHLSYGSSSHDFDTMHISNFWESSVSHVFHAQGKEINEGRYIYTYYYYYFWDDPYQTISHTTN